MITWVASSLTGYDEGEERHSTLVGGFKVVISRPYGYPGIDGETWSLRTYDGGPPRAKNFGGVRLKAKTPDDAKAEAVDTLRAWVKDLERSLT